MGRRIATTPSIFALSICALSILTLALPGCGSPAVYQVSEGTYVSQVPSEQQLGLDTDGAFPGGVDLLRQQGVERIEVEIGSDDVTVHLDGSEAAMLRIVERIDVTDREGSGPFKGKKQLLVLDEDLVLGELTIDDPVIWPGSFEQSPVITIKPRSDDERGPDVSCRADEPCLLLSSGVDPAGAYADANNPELDENPVESIQIDDESIEVTLDNGTSVTVPGTASSFTRSCGLSETGVWDLPAELGLSIGDPVLVHTLCPSTPGAAIHVIIMDRSAIPVLAPLTEKREGDWCPPGPNCLIFVPT